MPQANLNRDKKSRGMGKRLLEMAFVAGIKLDKIDPQKNQPKEYRDANQFSIQEAPTELDVEAQPEEEKDIAESSPERSDLHSSYLGRSRK
jgi:hypothetical protein